VEQSYVIHAVAHHNKSVQTDIYIKSCILIRIKPCCPKKIHTLSIAMRPCIAYNVNNAVIPQIL
jgi:hypothetical protein